MPFATGGTQDIRHGICTHFMPSKLFHRDGIPDPIHSDVLATKSRTEEKRYSLGIRPRAQRNLLDDHHPILQVCLFRGDDHAVHCHEWHDVVGRAGDPHGGRSLYQPPYTSGIPAVAHEAPYPHPPGERHLEGSRRDTVQIWEYELEFTEDLGFAEGHYTLGMAGARARTG